MTALLTYSLKPIMARANRWWHEVKERHYLMSAEIEMQRAREAQRNVAHYQRMAALARSNRIST